MQVALEGGKVDVCNSDTGIHVTPTRQIGRHFKTETCHTENRCVVDSYILHINVINSC
jgi:hypothetical protein